MDKPKIDDAMVMRCINAMDGTVSTAFDGARRKLEVRRGLEAALNLPPEPEIPVTDAMIDAGNTAWNIVNAVKQGDENYDAKPETIAVMAAVYRAMERQRLKDAKDQPAPEVPSERSPTARYHIMGQGGISFHMRKADRLSDPAHVHCRKDGK